MVTGFLFGCAEKAEASEWTTTTYSVESYKIFFANDSATIGDNDAAALKEISSNAQTNSGSRVSIIARTSRPASEEYNYNLAVKRAGAVSEFFSGQTTVLEAIGEREATGDHVGDRHAVVLVTTATVEDNPIFLYVGRLQGPTSHLNYNVIPVK